MTGGRTINPRRLAIIRTHLKAPSSEVYTITFRGQRSKNLMVENRYAEGRPERLAPLAGGLVRLSPHVLVATGTPGPLALKGATSVIPITAAASGDLVGSGLVASLARRGGHVTGLSGVSPDIAGKRLQLLKELLPGSRVWPFSPMALTRTPVR